MKTAAWAALLMGAALAVAAGGTAADFFDDLRGLEISEPADAVPPPSSQDFFDDLRRFAIPAERAPEAQKAAPSPAPDFFEDLRAFEIPGQPAPLHPSEKDREWIMKKGRYPHLAETPVIAVTWRDDAQKKQCEALILQLREAYRQTRYYSIQGDPCTTEVHAGKSLKLVEACRKACPPELLEARGFKARIIRNWELLQQLGKDRCNQ